MIGLIKFFGNEQRREQFLNGLLYCNTPEFYRNYKGVGISDYNESCIASLRGRENDPLCNIEWSPANDISDISVLPNAREMTIKRAADPDAWMHCWFVLRDLQTENQLLTQTENINKVKKEFGKYMVFLPKEQIPEFTQRLSSSSEKKLTHRQVAYSSMPTDQYRFCKSEKYAYQQEYRFSFGECDIKNVAHYDFNHKDGFRDIMITNQWIRAKKGSLSVILCNCQPIKGDRLSGHRTR